MFILLFVFLNFAVQYYIRGTTLSHVLNDNIEKDMTLRNIPFLLYCACLDLFTWKKFVPLSTGYPLLQTEWLYCQGNPTSQDELKTSNITTYLSAV